MPPPPEPVPEEPAAPRPEVDPRFLTVTPEEAGALVRREPSYALFPLKPGAKRPASGLRWPRLSSFDPKIVESTWAKYGTDGYGGVGIDTGKSRIVVVDVDGPISDELHAALTEVPTLIWSSATRAQPHYVFRQREEPGDIIGCPRLEGADVKGVGGLIARSSRLPLSEPGIEPALIPDKLLDILKEASHTIATTGTTILGAAYVTRDDLTDWLDRTRIHPDVSTAASEAFIETKLKEFADKVASGVARRSAARDVSLGMCIEAAAGLYNARDAHDRLQSVYRASRVSDPLGRNMGDPEKGWTETRRNDYSAMWRGALSRVLADWYSADIQRTQIRVGIVPDERLARVWENLLSPKKKRKKPKATRNFPVVVEPYVTRADTYPSGKPKMRESAKFGPLGELAATIAEKSEAPFEPLLAHALAYWGVWCGGGWRIVAAGQHTCDVWAVIVAPTSTVKGRANRSVRPVFDYGSMGMVPRTDAPALETGLASGQALIQMFRPYVPVRGVTAHAALAALGEAVTMKEEEDDGETENEWPDPRLLLIETEMGAMLSKMNSAGSASSILSQTLRQAFDRTALGNVTVARGIESVHPFAYHLGVVGHITPEELVATLSETDTYAGTTGRFLWFASDRHQLLSEGTDMYPDLWTKARQQLFGPTGIPEKFEGAGGDIPRGSGPGDGSNPLVPPVIRHVTWTPEAQEKWNEVYPFLASPPKRDMLVDAVAARGTGHVARLSLALWLSIRPDLATTIPTSGVFPAIPLDVLEAALAIWDYCSDSAWQLFGLRTGDIIFDRFLKAVHEAGPKGLSAHDQREISDRYKDYRTRAIDRGLVAVERRESEEGGRPAEVLVSRGHQQGRKKAK